MNRLTERINDKVYYAKGKYAPTTLCSEMETWDVRECMKKLAAYEDTGLEPEEINRTPITKNKNIELPCFAGDTVYYIKYPTYAASWRNNKPVMVSMKVIKVTYEAQQGFEKIRIDTSYKNNSGDDSFDFFIWDDGFLYNTLAEAEEKIKAFSQAHEKGNQIEEAEKALEGNK